MEFFDFITIGDARHQISVDKIPDASRVADREIYDTFQYSLVRLEGEDEAFYRILQEDIVSHLDLGVDEGSLLPVFLVDNSVGLHFEQRMAHALPIRRIDIVCYRISSEMAHIPVHKCSLLVCRRSTQQVKSESPGVGILMIREIFFPNDNVSHEIPVNKILAMAPDDFIDACREQ